MHRIVRHLICSARCLASTAAVASSALVGSGIVVATVATPASAATARDTTVSSADDVATAQALARAQNSKVLVDGLMTPTDQVWANPDGSLTREKSLGQERVKQADGSWADVNLSLVRSQSGITSVRPVVPVTYADAGATTIASTVLRAGTVSVSWSGALPAPILTATRAVYADVQPGVDLIVDALRTGFEVSFLVRSKPSGPLSLPLTMNLPAGADVQQVSDGGLAITDASGASILRGGAPFMFGAAKDLSTNQPKSSRGVAGTLGANASAGAGTRRTWTLTPDPTFFTDPTVTYPVTVDPIFNVLVAADAYIKSTAPTTAFDSATRLYIGTPDDGVTKYRTLIHISSIPSTLSGMYVEEAHLRMYNSYSASCDTASTPVNLWRGYAWVAGATWASQPGNIDASPLSTSHWAHGRGAAGACQDPAYDDMDMTSLARNWSSGAATSKDFKITSVETTVPPSNATKGYKEFWSSENSSGVPRFYFTYRAYPSTPTTPSVTPVVGSGPSGYWTSTTTPSLTSTVHSDTESSVQAKFEIYNGSTQVWWGYGSTVPSDGSSMATVPASVNLTQNVLYTVRVWGVSGGATSNASSPEIQFKVDTGVPVPPTVTSSLYLEGKSIAATDDSPNKDFNWQSSSANVLSYDYAMDGGAFANVPASHANIAWYPMAGGAHSLAVRAVSQAGLVSPTTTYQFAVTGPTAPSTPFNLEAGALDTGSPLVSGIATGDAEDDVTVEFYVTDAAGSSIGGTPYASAIGNSGQRFSLKFDDGVLAVGSTYKWWMTACQAHICSNQTSQMLITPTQPSVSSNPSAVTVSIPAVQSDESFEPGAASCAGGGCPAVSDETLMAGQAGGKLWRSALKLDLSAIPAGAKITAASLQLGTATAAGASTTWMLEAHSANGSWDSTTLGPDLAAKAGDTASVTAVTAGLPSELDLTDLVAGWLTADVANNGVILQLADESQGGLSVASTRGSSGQPQLQVSYVPAGAPSVARDLQITAGDSGLLASWAAPSQTGYSGSDVAYNLCVNDGDGTLVYSGTTTDTRAVVGGLLNGHTYSVSLSARTAYGASPTVSALGAPSSVAFASNYVDASREFLQARNRLLTGVATTSADALVGGTQTAMISNRLAAEAPAILTEHQLAQIHGGSEVSASSVGLADTLVIGRAGGVQVVTTASYNLTSPTQDVTGASLERVFDYRPVGGSDVLSAWWDSRGGYSPITEETVGDADVIAGGATFAAMSSTPQVQALAMASGWPANGSESAPADASDSTIIEPAGVVNWARDHYSEKHVFSSNCTHFASRALHYGGHMDYVSGWFRSDAHWWRTSFLGISNQTYSWASANHLANFLDGRPGYWVQYISQVRPGDVIFYQYPGWDRINHTAIITKVNASTGQIWVTQSAHDYKDMALSEQIARIYSAFPNGSLNLYVRHIGG